MRLIDADELQYEYKKHHDGKRLLLIDVAPTVEPQLSEEINKWLDPDIDGEIAVERIRDIVYRSVQPVDPERISGRWIKISPAGIYECSICGKNVMTSDIDAYDFCHGCGNPMEVIKNGNE